MCVCAVVWVCDIMISLLVVVEWIRALPGRCAVARDAPIAATLRARPSADDLAALAGLLDRSLRWNGVRSLRRREETGAWARGGPAVRFAMESPTLGSYRFLGAYGRGRRDFCLRIVGAVRLEVLRFARRADLALFVALDRLGLERLFKPLSAVLGRPGAALVRLDAQLSPETWRALVEARWGGGVSVRIEAERSTLQQGRRALRVGVHAPYALLVSYDGGDADG